jgi:hypothetical protein
LRFGSLGEVLEDEGVVDALSSASLGVEKIPNLLRILDVELPAIDDDDDENDVDDDADIDTDVGVDDVAADGVCMGVTMNVDELVVSESCGGVKSDMLDPVVASGTAKRMLGSGGGSVFLRERRDGSLLIVTATGSSGRSLTSGSLV